MAVTLAGGVECPINHIFQGKQMKFAMKSLAVACAFLAMGTAQAASQTLTVGSTISVADAKGMTSTLGDLSGSGTLNFANNFVSALNIVQASITQVAPATLAAPTSTNITGVAKYISASAAAPVTALTVGFDAPTSTLDVEQVATAGGFTIATKKNGATSGSGSLSITNLNVDIATKSIYADIDGANGVGLRNHFLLWSFDDLNGSTTIQVPKPTATTASVTTAFKLTGLWASTESANMFIQALNLNFVGKSALSFVNTKVDGVRVDGFGSLSVLTSATVQAVPEPQTYAMVLSGVGVVLLARRRRSTS